MLTGVSTIDQESYAQILRFCIRTGGNLMTFGPAGIGKTEMAMQAAEELGFECVYLNLSVLEAPDLLGLPMIDEQSKTATYATPQMLPLLNDNSKKVVLLVDEVDKAKPELQNPCLELFQFRGINGRPLNIHSVVATGNLPDEGAFSLPVSHALTNRCMVYRLTHAYDPWQEWAVEAGVNNLIVGFLSRNQEYLLQPPPSGDDTAYCHPTPRAWTLAAKDLDETSDGDSVDFQTMIVASRVGTSAAVKFKVWLEHYRHIEPIIDKLIKEGTHPNTKKMSIDRVMVCALAGMNALASECRNLPSGEKAKKAKDKNIERIVKNVMGWFKTLDSEYCVCAIKSTLNMDMIRDNKLTQYSDFMDAFLKIKKAWND